LPDRRRPLTFNPVTTGPAFEMPFPVEVGPKMHRIYRRLPWAPLLLGIVLLAGCSEDSSIIPPAQPQLDAQYLTIQPRSVLPEETAELTAVVSGFPDASYDWDASGGTLLSNDKILVEWEAPDVAGEYTLSYRARYENVTSSFSRRVSVNYVQPLAGSASFVGWPTWDGSTGRVYYLDSAVDPADPAFDGFALMSMNASDGGAKSTEVSRHGLLHNYTGDLDAVAYSTVELVGFSFAEPLTKIFRATLPGGAETEIATPIEYVFPPTSGKVNRRDLVFQPRISRPGNWIAYTREIPDTTENPTTSEDSTEVFAYHVGSDKTYRITTSSPVGGEMPINHYPSVSPNEDYFLYIRQAGGRSHLYSRPVLGDSVSLDPATEVRVSDVSGRGLGRDVYRYSPDGTKVAYIGSGGGLFVNDLTGSSEFGGGEGVNDFAWSPDGSRMAIIASDQLGVAEVSTGEFEEARGGFEDDVHFGVVWSADGNRLYYYVARSPDYVWLESYDIDAQDRVSLSPHAGRFVVENLRRVFGNTLEFRPAPSPEPGQLDVLFAVGDYDLVSFTEENLYKAHY
jgi:hypothetical protein